MKLVTYKRDRESSRPGLLVGDHPRTATIVDLVRATAWVSRTRGGAHDEHTTARQYGASVLEFIERRFAVGQT